MWVARIPATNAIARGFLVATNRHRVAELAVISRVLIMPP
jgi:hypothetical protein